MVLASAGKIAAYMEECSRLNIAVLPPHVNESEQGFSVFENSIRFGLLAIRNLGRGLIQRILSERTMNGPFTTFYDFCKRMQGRDLNRRAVESLIRCGAFDGLGNNRREMLMAVGPLLDQLEDDKRRNIEGQIGLFDFGGEEKTESSRCRKPRSSPKPNCFLWKRKSPACTFPGTPCRRMRRSITPASPRALMRLPAAPPGNPTNIKTSSMWTFWPLWKA